MKLSHLPVGLVLFGAMAFFSLACDGEETSYESTSGDNGADTAKGTGDTAGDAAADAEAEAEELPTGPMPEEAFNQIKELWDGQILRIEESVKTLTQLNEQYKDETLGKMIDQIKTDIVAVRQKHASLTRENAHQVAEVEIPKLMEAASQKLAEAMERVQEVGKSKIPGG